MDLEDVGVAAQVEALGPAREAAEAAAEVALVGVVDVAVDDVGDHLAAAPAAQLVGDAATASTSARARGRGARSRRPAAGGPRASARGSRPGRGRGAPGRLGRPSRQPRPPTRPTAAAPAPGRARRGRAPSRSAGAPRRSRRPGQPGGEERPRQVRARVVDLGLGRQGGALDQGARGQGVAQGPDPVGAPVADHEVDRARGDRVEGLLQGADRDRHARGDARQPAELDRLLDPVGVRAQEGGAGPDERVEHRRARALVAQRDAPAGHPALVEGHRAVGVGDPGDGGPGRGGGLDRQQTVGERPGDGRLVQAGPLAGRRARRPPRPGDPAEGDAHAATSAAGPRACSRASPAASAMARTRRRMPGARKRSSAGTRGRS